jgi:hypothetical protein
MKWLKFAISLSQVNFEELTEGQRLDLKKKFQRFLRSMDPPGEAHQVVRQLKTRGKHAPEFITDLLGGEDVDEREAQVILRAELENLTSRINVAQFRKDAKVSLAIARFGETFDFLTLPHSGVDRIFVLFGEHLRGSGISGSMLTRCPECQKIFIASRKPRLDRKFHCSPACSSNAASKAYRERKILERAKRLIATGLSVKKAAEIVKKDLAWLESKLEKDRDARIPQPKKSRVKTVAH